MGGDLVGRNSGTISACYSTGSVAGGVPASRVGGLVGQNGGRQRKEVLLWAAGGME